MNFSKTWDAYKAGFGEAGSQSEMWLGNDRIHSLTTKKTELLIQLTAFDGTEGFAIYSHFSIADEDHHYQLSVGEFSGNLPDKLGMHNSYNFSVTKCVGANAFAGWWFTSSCGGVMLNSGYGRDTGLMKWSDFPTVGDDNGKLKKTTMKIRTTLGEVLTVIFIRRKHIYLFSFSTS